MKCCGELKNSSRDRLHEEMLKILNCGRALRVFERSWQKGLFQTIYPGFSAWLQASEGHAHLPWVKKALRQFDVWKEAGLKPMPALQHALLFGPYIEGLAGADVVHVDEHSVGAELAGQQVVQCPGVARRVVAPVAQEHLRVGTARLRPLG